MKRRIVLASCLVVVGLVVAWLWRDALRPSAQGGGLQSLSGRPGLVVEAKGGQRVDLASQKGRIVIVHFWATWCKPCVEEMPELVRFWQRYANRKDISLYAVGVDKEGWEKITPFLENYHVDLPVYLDPGGKVAERFGSTMFPETYIVNRKGKVVQKVAEAVTWSDPQVATYFDQLIASPE